MDENGEVVDGDQIMAIIGNHMRDNGKLKKDTIVATIMSNGVDQSLGQHLHDASQLRQALPGIYHDLEQMQGAQQAVPRGVLVQEDDMPRLFAAQAGADKQVIRAEAEKLAMLIQDVMF